jgi:hypothetical protein
MPRCCANQEGVLRKGYAGWQGSDRASAAWSIEKMPPPLKDLDDVWMKPGGQTVFRSGP